MATKRKPKKGKAAPPVSRMQPIVGHVTHRYRNGALIEAVEVRSPADVEPATERLAREQRRYRDTIVAWEPLGKGPATRGGTWICPHHGTEINLNDEGTAPEEMRCVQMIEAGALRPDGKWDREVLIQRAQPVDMRPTVELRRALDRYDEDMMARHGAAQLALLGKLIGCDPFTE